LRYRDHALAILVVLHRVAACCSVLQCVAACCSVLQCVAVPRPCTCRFFCAAMPCSVLQHFAVCCSVLQCVSVRFSVLQYRGHELADFRDRFVSVEICGKL